MKIDYVSDIHVNHWMLWTHNQLKWEDRTRRWVRKLLENGNGEVLVIAGDFSEFNAQSIWVLDEAAKYYERVYYTFGNHDLYILTKTQRKKYGDSMGRLKELMKAAAQIPNVVPLIKSVDTFKGITFAGDAMWYIPKTEEDWSFYRQTSSDSDTIFLNGCTVDEIPAKLHQESIDWYNSIEDIPVDVFVSHVPPIHNPLSPFNPNTCYLCQPPYLNAAHWICGHDHIQRKFERSGLGTVMHMNAIGYPQHYSNYPQRNVVPEGEIDEYKSFGVKTFEV